MAPRSHPGQGRAIDVPVRRAGQNAVRSRTTPAFWVAALGTLLPSSGWGQAPEGSSELDFDLLYVAPPMCPVRAEVVRRIEERSQVDGAGEQRPASDGRGASYAPVVIQIHVADDARHARLQYFDTSGHEVSREVVAKDCAELVDALALIAAMSLREDTTETPPPSSPPTSRDPAPARDQVSVPATGPSRPSPSTPDDLTESRPSARQPWRWLLGVQATTTSVVAPDPAWGIAGVVGAAYPGGGLLAPRFRLGLGRSLPARAESTIGDALFTLTRVFVEGCPVAWPRQGRFAARPCLQLETGSLTAEAQRVEHSHDARLLWGAVAGTLSGELRALDHLDVEAQAGVTLPLVSDQFFLRRGETPVHEVPRFGWSAAIGMLTSF